MNKGFVALLVVLALLVIVSPGIVGMLAERSVDEQIEWAELDNKDILITAELFDRGWFSSQGRHRIELQESSNADGIKTMMGLSQGDTLPVLIVDTKLNHGPIALSSVGDENASLSPGLGQAVSTLSLESADGEIIELPGTIYSSIALNGDLNSNYVATADSNDVASWGNIDIGFESTVSSGAYAYDGNIESVQLGDIGIDLTKLAFDGDLAPSEFGFAVGDAVLTLDLVTFDVGGDAPFSIGPVVFDSSTSINDDKLDSVAELNMIVGDVPGLGHIGLDTRFTFTDVDGAALQRLVQGTQNMPSNSSPEELLVEIEEELLGFLAAGAELHFERLDIALPQGTIKSEMTFTFLENDDSNLVWSSLLLALEADAKFEVPQLLADMAMLMSPQPGLVESFLVKNGDVYELEAAYKKGLLTVNGVPMALPIQ